MTVALEPNPTVARRELALYFRTLRNQRGRGLDELAGYLGVSEVQASRLDRGVRGLRADDVRKLVSWYAVDGADLPRLLDLVGESRRRAWWQQADIPDPAYRTLIGMEQAADFISEYGSGVIPGLLQTRAYAEAAARGSTPDLTDDEVDAAVDVRMRRQEILRRPRPPRVHVIVDEAVLARVIGGPGTMREQLAHLVHSAHLPSLTVQVIDFAHGAHPGLNSQFVRVDAGADLPDLVYVEGLRGKAEFTGAAETDRYRETWEYLVAIALSPQRSLDRVERYLGQLAPRSSPARARGPEED